jgi:hypothetical protein
VKDDTLSTKAYSLSDAQIVFAFGLSIQRFDPQSGSKLVHIGFPVSVHVPLIRYIFVQVLEVRRLRTLGLKIEVAHSSFSVPQG